MKITFTSLFLFVTFSLNTFAQDPHSTRLEGHTDSVLSVEFSPDGQTLASGSRDYTIRLWDVATGNLLRTLRGHANAVNSVAFSPDGKTLASASFDNTFRLWDAATGNLLRTIEGHMNVDWVFSVSFSPDGETLAGGTDDDIRLWEVGTGNEIHTLEGHWGTVLSVSFSPDGKTLASGGTDDTIRLWDVATGNELGTHSRHTDNVNSVSFSPDGKTLASGSEDDDIKLWDVATGYHLRTLSGHTDSVHSVSFSPNGKTLASGSRDNTIRLWDVSTGNEIHKFKGDWGAVFSVTIDGPTLASGSIDDTIRLWNLPRVSITALPVDAPAIGGKLTFNIGITDGENIAGYQARIRFDDSALRYVESANGDYLPANAFVVPPVIEGNEVTVGATSVAGDRSGDGTLATLTFEFIAIKESTLTLSEAVIANGAGNRLPFLIDTSTVEAGAPRLPGDVNLDGVVNILDLVMVASSFGKESPIDDADVNKDGVVDILDLVLVAGALGDAAAAPSLYPQALRLFTALDIQQWLSQARHLDLTDASMQRGVLFLEYLLAAFTPQEPALLPNYPNPFNPETWIPYQLAEAADVILTIYAVDGTLARTLALGYQPVGIYQGKSRAAYWDGKNALGEPVASGIYFYTLTAGDFSATRKMLVRK